MEQLCNNAYLFSDSFWKSGFAFKYAFVHWRPPIKTIGIPEKEDEGANFHFWGVGNGCVYKAEGNYPNIWTLLDTLDLCPRGYLN
jgi:hypothetical protein